MLSDCITLFVSNAAKYKKHNLDREFQLKAAFIARVSNITICAINMILDLMNNRQYHQSGSNDKFKINNDINSSYSQNFKILKTISALTNHYDL